MIPFVDRCVDAFVKRRWDKSTRELTSFDAALFIQETLAGMRSVNKEPEAFLAAARDAVEASSLITNQHDMYYKTTLTQSQVQRSFIDIIEIIARAAVRLDDVNGEREREKKGAICKTCRRRSCPSSRTHGKSV